MSPLNPSHQSSSNTAGKRGQQKEHKAKVKKDTRKHDPINMSNAPINSQHLKQHAQKLHRSALSPMYMYYSLVLWCYSWLCELVSLQFLCILLDLFSSVCLSCLNQSVNFCFVLLYFILLHFKIWMYKLMKENLVPKVNVNNL